MVSGQAGSDCAADLKLVARAASALRLIKVTSRRVGRDSQQAATAADSKAMGAREFTQSAQVALLRKRVRNPLGRHCAMGWGAPPPL
jgi:hypothetical protein